LATIFFNREFSRSSSFNLFASSHFHSAVLITPPVIRLFSDFQVLAHLHNFGSFTQQSISLPQFTNNLLWGVMSFLHIVLLAYKGNHGLGNYWITLRGSGQRYSTLVRVNSAARSIVNSEVTSNRAWSPMHDLRSESKLIFVFTLDYMPCRQKSLPFFKLLSRVTFHKSWKMMATLRHHATLVVCYLCHQ